MYNISKALTDAISHITAMHVMDINQIDAASANTIATPSNVLYLSIEDIEKIPSSTAHVDKDGIAYGKGYEVYYRLCMRHENALTNNTMVDLLEMGLGGTSSTLSRVPYMMGRNIFYLMQLEGRSHIFYPKTDEESTPIRRVHVSINTNHNFIVDVDDAAEK